MTCECLPIFSQKIPPINFNSNLNTLGFTQLFPGSIYSNWKVQIKQEFDKNDTQKRVAALLIRWIGVNSCDLDPTRTGVVQTQHRKAVSGSEKLQAVGRGSRWPHTDIRAEWQRHCCSQQWQGTLSVHRPPKFANSNLCYTSVHAEINTQSVDGRGERSKICSFAKCGAMDTIFGAACKELWGEQASLVVKGRTMLWYLQK